ncbi:XdhC and CoxI family [Acididesulfobacillus acetoxydans]|uniref:Xanthine and CO dehydrogenases maturation factor, XdhC/CoxF n=1 Tax=Acididesulfobacillus acetoxydans TaxID=1561005 RepID=A0A8S0Y391_9FIRM|nr:XdhC/CoxI family protein [Acididesulfobacillus acetoxydans]CAA7601805.1 XdhC and CoxI family [Acididesulfobacillus acetoxydans]CEJ09225.1 Xanthine and CO dehydrogenases maturation factor, XdhC/CoxF [Acididesulfobacillus acetoxydans]
MDDTLIRSILDTFKNRVHAVMATIVRTEGSTPREPGTRMLIFADGQTVGTIGGGSTEQSVLAGARALLNTNGTFPPEIRHLGINQTANPKLSPVCGGSLDVLLEEVGDRGFWQHAGELAASGREIVLITALFPPYAKTIWDSRGNILGGEPQAGLAVTTLDLTQIRARRAALVWETRALSWLVEPVLRKERLLILGAGHVGREVAYYAKPLDFEVSVIDDRVTCVRPEFFPGAQSVLCTEFVDGIKNYRPQNDTYVVIATWSHQKDEECLNEVLNYPAKYIGMLGSQTKVRRIVTNLRDKGYTAENIARLRAPVGLDIGAQTPAEIALSILAEIISVKRTGQAPRETTAAP